MRFFGLDTSLRGTGFAVVETPVVAGGGKAHQLSLTVRSETLVPPPGFDGMARLRWIRNTVRSRLDGVDWAHGAIEGYAFGAKGAALSGLHSVGAILRMHLYDKQYCTVQDVPPTVLKKFMTGTGTANKIKMLLTINKFFGLELEDHNQADALALALYAAACNDSVLLSKAKLECTDKSVRLK